MMLFREFVERPSLEQKIFDWFSKNELKPIETIAKDVNASEDEVDTMIHQMLHNFIYRGNYNNDVRSGENINTDGDQITKGIKVESEHVGDDVILAKKIAMDHITEIPDYYDRLEKIENEAKTAKLSN